jgi:hypothetical protein
MLLDAVINEARLWAVPNHIVPHNPSTMISNPKYNTILESQDSVHCRLYACQADKNLFNRQMLIRNYLVAYEWSRIWRASSHCAR